MTAPVSELDPFQRMVTAYARKADRERFQTLFALDRRCAQILRTTSEPIVGQMRLAWWRDAMTGAASVRPRGDPVLDALTSLEADGVLRLTAMVPLVDGWECLLTADGSERSVLEAYARQRGGTLFDVLARGGGAADARVVDVGTAWALWDLARNSTGELQTSAMAALAAMPPDWRSTRLPRALRPLSILRRLAVADIVGGALDRRLMRPRTAARIMWHGITGH